MGTSSSYGGPKGTGALLPPWTEPVPEGNPTEPLESDDNASTDKPSQEGANSVNIPIQPPILSVGWGVAKNTFTRYSSSVNRDRRNMRGLRSTIRTFVKAQGGSRGASRASKSGRVVTQRIGQVFSSIIGRGAEATIKSIGLAEFLGADAETLLARLVDYIAPDTALLEENVARSAALDVLAELFERFGVEEKGITALNSLTSETLKTVLLEYINKYIYTRILETLSKSSESYSAATLVRVEKDIKDYVSETVKYDFGQVDMLTLDWLGKEGKEMVGRIYDEGYSLLEKIL